MSSRAHALTQARIVHQTYLGTAEKVAALVRDRTAPVPLEATAVDVGLPGALWLAAQQTGVFTLLQSLWPEPTRAIAGALSAAGRDPSESVSRVPNRSSRLV